MKNEWTTAGEVDKVETYSPRYDFIIFYLSYARRRPWVKSACVFNPFHCHACRTVKFEIIKTLFPLHMNTWKDFYQKSQYSN